MKRQDYIPVGDLADDARDYLKLRLAEVKLSVVEQLATFFGNALGLTLLIAVCLSGTLFLGTALVLWLGDLLGSYMLAALITGGVLILAGVVMYLIRRAFASALVSTFSKMLFPESKEKDMDYGDDEEFE